MELVTIILRATIISYGLIFAVIFIRDCIKHKEEFRSRPYPTLLLIGFIANFLDTLGVGSFAIIQTGFKLTKTSSDEVMPGTLNVGNSIPSIFEFVLLLGLVKVDPLTLVLMIGAAILGAVTGAGIVSKWSLKTVRIALGSALLFLGFVMACQLLEIGPFGVTGTAVGLYGIKLFVAVGVNFVLGALMTIGVGLYTPCIALCSMLGLNVKVAFPVMSGSCAFLTPSCGLRFIKEEKYDRVAAICITSGGLVGILIAYFFVKSLPIDVLTGLLILVMVYTATMFYKDALKTQI